MPKILQINATANWGSTGRIAEQINILSRAKGWDCYIAYGRYSNASQSNLIKVGSKLGVIAHFLQNRIFDNEGLASRCATKRLISEIKELAPDIIHLHNIHDHWINYKLLFEYLNTTDIPVVWTQHDCWAFTGGCPHYSMNGCYKWQKGCIDCKYKGNLLDRSQKHYSLRKNLFLSNKNLTIVTVSDWLKLEIEKSFMQSLSIKTIYNGIDLTVFYPQQDKEIFRKYSLSKKYILLCLATTWSAKKGFNDYIQLAKILPSDCIIIMVGVTSEQKRRLPENIIGIERTQDVNELVNLYSSSNIVLNLSYEESFGLTTVEGFACGTPAIVYDTTASPELISSETGVVVKAGDINGIVNAINYIRESNSEAYSKACRKRAEELYDKNKSFAQYVELYESLLNNR